MSKALQPIDMMTPGQNLESYIQTVGRIPILTAEEEKSTGRTFILSRRLRSGPYIGYVASEICCAHCEKLLWLRFSSRRLNPRRKRRLDESGEAF